MGIYTPKKSAQVNFLWGKNDVKTAIQQFYTPKTFIPPKTNFWLRPWTVWDKMSEKLRGGDFLLTL